jgi:hypothetical protein
MNDSSERQEPRLVSHNSSEDSLEDGIASVFAAIQADGFSDAVNDDGEPDATLVLLAELNRIWSRPSQAA